MCWCLRLSPPGSSSGGTPANCFPSIFCVTVEWGPVGLLASKGLSIIHPKLFIYSPLNSPWVDLLALQESETWGKGWHRKRKKRKRSVKKARVSRRRESDWDQERNRIRDGLSLFSAETQWPVLLSFKVMPALSLYLSLALSLSSLVFHAKQTKAIPGIQPLAKHSLLASNLSAFPPHLTQLRHLLKLTWTGNQLQGHMKQT